MKSLKNRISRIIPVALALGLTAAMLSGLTGCGTEGRIEMGRAQWNYNVIQTNIIVHALEDKGYNVRINDIYEMGLMYAALGEGSVDLYADGWLPTMQESYYEANKDKLVVGGDIYGEPVPLSWAIPAYTAEAHNIYSIEDLQSKGSLFNGRLYGYEAGSGGSERSLVALQEYGLSNEFEFITGSVPTLLAELKAGMAQNRDVMVVLWRPHPIFSQLDIQILDDSKNVFGTNYVKYVANKDFAGQNPEIIEFLENVLIPLNEMEAMMLQNEEHGVSEDALALEWFNNNKAVIETWWP